MLSERGIRANEWRRVDVDAADRAGSDDTAGANGGARDRLHAGGSLFSNVPGAAVAVTGRRPILGGQAYAHSRDHSQSKDGQFGVDR